MRNTLQGRRPPSHEGTSRGRWHAVIAAALLAALSTAVPAQMPGAPVLQNAFASPGFAAALDVGAGGGSLYAAAASWVPGSARLQLSGGIGVRAPSGGGSTMALGGRVAVPIVGSSGGRLGLGVFGGYGGSGSIDNPDGSTSGAVTFIPVGASVGYRQRIGAGHGFSIYASPIYLWSNRSGAEREGMFRASIGLDVVVTDALGLTAGLEGGQNGSVLSGAPTGTVFGAALSYAFGR